MFGQHFQALAGIVGGCPVPGQELDFDDTYGSLSTIFYDSFWYSEENSTEQNSEKLKNSEVLSLRSIEDF